VCECVPDRCAFRCGFGLPRKRKLSTLLLIVTFYQRRLCRQVVKYYVKPSHTVFFELGQCTFGKR
jgi:hypothetical protein